MATKATETLLSNLVINRVSSAAVFEDMISNNQVNADELYLVADDDDFEAITTLQIEALFT